MWTAGLACVSHGLMIACVDMVHIYDAHDTWWCERSLTFEPGELSFSYLFHFYLTAL